MIVFCLVSEKEKEKEKSLFFICGGGGFFWMGCDV